MIFLLFSLLLSTNESTYQDQTSGLRIQFPAGWELQSDLPEKTARFGANQPQQRWIATGNESPKPWYDVMNLKFLVQSMGLRAPKYQVISAQQIGSDDYQAIAVTFLLEIGGQQIHYRVYSLGNEDHAFLLVFGSKAENWNLLEKDMEAIVKSARFEGASQTAASQARQPDLSPLLIMCQPQVMAATDKLMAALEKDRVTHAEVETLVAEGADVNGLGKAGTPLSIAIRKDHRMATLWLLDHGADLSHPVNDITELSIQASLPIRMLLRSRWKAMGAANPRDASEHDQPQTRPVVSGQPTEKTPTSNLLSALTDGDLAGAEKAMAEGADPKEKHPLMGVNAIVLTRQLIKELVALNLDTKGWEALESKMTAAGEAN